MKRIIHIFIVSCLFLLYYGVLGCVFKLYGYTNLEQLFITDKLQLLFSGNANTLEVFYFTYPVLTQIVSLPASFIDIEMAPTITSIVCMAIFAAYLTVKLFELDFKWFSFITSVYFLISPVMLFLVLSGNSTYLYFILYFIYFHFLLKYSREFTIYNFVLIGIALSIFVFLEYNFLWIIVFTIPLIFFFSIFNTIGINRTYVGVFKQISQKSSQKRKLIGRFLSTTLVIIFTPIVALLSYILINIWFSGEAFYFDETSEFGWNNNNFLAYIFNSYPYGNFEESFVISYALKQSLLLAPIFFTVLFLGRRKLLFQCILIIVPLWLIFYKSYKGAHFLSLQELLIITAAGMAGVIHLLSTPLSTVYKQQILKMTLVVTGIFTISLIGEYYYFVSTNSSIEKNFFQFVKQQEKNEYVEDFMKIAAYVNTNLEKKDIILADNTIFYPTMAVTRKNVIYVDQFTEQYFESLQMPSNYVDYLLISKPNSFYFEFDQLNNLLSKRKLIKEKIFESRMFSLYKLRKYHN